ncbi:FAD-dependent monooxygenase [Actinospica durhamensis]|uniref:FAD-dependent monooxygenase n=1 Tax=Actinospica durhamensis TaxID=1508375 RepID=A0A941IL87_9ACTN|nr:FAD-dependent monooxygenase [Actinospica durhamensis]MBR7832725.1 FAD-dependent monooxygenase [Actinospica durhamensis]
MPAEPNASAPPDGGAPDLDTEVLVVGAGPVGLWLAAELCAAGVRVCVLEARQERASWSRGFVVHPRTLEILDSRGAVTALLGSGRQLSTWHYAMGTRRLDFTRLPSAFPFLVLQPQARTEELLEAHLERCGGSVRRGWRAVGLTQGQDRVSVRVRDGEGESELTARFVVGCDGARSTVRQVAGIGFHGNPDTMLSPSALVEFADPPKPQDYIQTHEQGTFFVIALPDGRFVVSTIDHAVMNDVGMVWTAEAVRDSVRRITGTDYGMRATERVATLGNSAKQAERYREGRVLLAGDAAHVHFPMGGQGMNLGIQDAHNLAWRLTAVVRAQRERPDAGDALLDGYEAERRPAGEHVLEDVRAQMALVAATGADGSALRARFEALLGEHPEVNLQYARRLAGLEVRYSAQGEDPRLGTRVPDLLLDVADGVGPSEPKRLYELLAEAGAGRFASLRLGGASDEADDAADVAVEQAKDEAPAVFAARGVLGPDWALRGGWGGRAEAVLIRPDGHVVRITPGENTGVGEGADGGESPEITLG